MRVRYRAFLLRRRLARAATVGKATWKHQSRSPAFDFHPPLSIQSRSFLPRTVATVGNTSPVHQPVPCGEGDLVVNPASSPRLGYSVLYYHSNGTTPLFSHNSSRSFPFGVSQMSRQSEIVNTRCSSINCTQSEQRWISYKKAGYLRPVDGVLYNEVRVTAIVLYRPLHAAFFNQPVGSALQSCPAGSRC